MDKKNNNIDIYSGIGFNETFNKAIRDSVNPSPSIAAPLNKQPLVDYWAGKTATIKIGEVKILLHDGKESALNTYIDCRDGIIYRIKYRDTSGYGTYTEAFYCINAKHEAVALVIHKHYKKDEIHEESLHFDSDSWKFIEQLLGIKGDGKGGVEIYRSYMIEQHG